MSIFLNEDWDGIFSMRYSMLPKHLITEKTAEKILFIGKAVRVLLANFEVGGHKNESYEGDFNH